MHDDTNYAGRDREEPTVRLARDDYSTRQRDLQHHPEAVVGLSRKDVADYYGNVQTWNVDLYRVGRDVTAFIQRSGSDGYIRLVLPPEVTERISVHHAGLIRKAARRTGKRGAADRRARGEPVGNPEALRRWREAKRTAKR